MKKMAGFRGLVAMAALSATGAVACGGARPPATSPSAGPPQACAALGPQALRFGETLEQVSAEAKPRLGSYAGLLELLLTMEQASNDLEAQLAATRVDPAEAAMGDAVKKAGTALERMNEIARTERENAEKRAAKMAPVAKESDAAYRDLRAACEGKKSAECAGVLATLDQYAQSPVEEQPKVIEQLAALKAGPALGKLRDRAVASSRAAFKVIADQQGEIASLAKKMPELEKVLADGFSGLAEQCKTAPLPTGAFVAEDKPDPRKLTVLVKVGPPAGIGQTFRDLARASRDEDEKAFYEARAMGGFGSGFLVVRAKPEGGREVLVITNRHVVELADKAALELADGTSLGGADILYSDDTHDVAVLRPSQPLTVEKGFSFSDAPAKDQQVVIATGFPGLGNRPSYQTTRGYVSNESFRMDDESVRPLTYLQHTAPIDPGSSGGPLTDEHGAVLGVNTLKVTNRENVGFAVPSASILETIRRADAARSASVSPQHRREAARLACLAFVGELSSHKPRREVLENLVSNELTSAVGLDASEQLGDDEAFGHLWLEDSVRAMRIATIVRVDSVIALSGGTSVLETCSDADAGDMEKILDVDRVRFKVRLANWDTREVAFHWEQGHYKLAKMDLRPPVMPKAPSAKATSSGRRAAPPSTSRRPKN